MSSGHSALGLNRTEALLGLAMVLYLWLSAPLLAVMGIPYDVPMGSFPAKIHPGTYVLALAALSAWEAERWRLAGLKTSLQRDPLLHASLACMVACFAWAVLRHGPSGLAFFIDTLMAPAIAGLLITAQSDAARSRLKQLVMWLIVINAVLALGEYASRVHLVPGIKGSGEDDPDAFFRATGLLGHPLTNAKVTVTALPFIGALPWALRWRVAAVVLLSLALLAFGGRTSLVMGALVYGLAGLACLLVHIARGRFSYLQLTGGAVGLLLGMALVTAIVLGTGLGDRVFHNFTWDNSADVRFLAWQTLDHFGGTDIWMGQPIEGIDHLAERVGIDMRYEAIENFWVYMLLLLGITGFLPFVLGLALLAVHLIQRSGLWQSLAVLVYIVVASGTNSLASKTISLLVLTVLVLTSAPERAPRAARQPAPMGLRLKELQ
ncbi:VpsF family polysaccharide biosynthesis protein [Aquabacterium sp.]|uniref:VpsF family polysaccharide biosynthesis protein n=1 Tax=Aquabacterium sp. TaxID=1872578 RepID=UPI0025BBB5FD|nr:VpsF family polysaccharide biosynthesis protein [Aquabacterium sp.]